MILRLDIGSVAGLKRHHLPTTIIVSSAALLRRHRVQKVADGRLIWRPMVA
jgi:hypothetical protein